MFDAWRAFFSGFFGQKPEPVGDNPVSFESRRPLIPYPPGRNPHERFLLCDKYEQFDQLKAAILRGRQPYPGMRDPVWLSAWTDFQKKAADWIEATGTSPSQSAILMDQFEKFVTWLEQNLLLLESHFPKEFAKDSWCQRLQGILKDTRQP